jgi:hypothetical protein
MDLTKLMMTGVLALLPVMASTADAQAPTEEPVPVEMVQQGRLTLPDGGQFSAPDETWEWRVIRGAGMEGFALAKKGEGRGQITVAHVSVEHVNDEFMQGFVNGMLRGSAAQGAQVIEPHFVLGDFPMPGTYRFEASAKHPKGSTFTRVGYILPMGYVVMMSYKGSAEPPELRKVTASFAAKAQP